KYTQQGAVRLEIDADNSHAFINVRDTGVGIAPEHIDHIFEPFWQVNRTQGRPGEGTGLGLAVVHRIVLLLGGSITVASPPGAGSTFRITLPLAPSIATPLDATY